MKKNISSLELAALVNELQFLVNGKISQVYSQENKELLLQLHVSGQEKLFLRIIPGKWLCLLQKKEVPLTPSSFCMQLRKYLSNAVIRSLQQKDAERIVVFELQKDQQYRLIIEFFSRGNIILTDTQGKIIAALERQRWKDRTVVPGETYQFPHPGINWKQLSEKVLRDLLQKSEKKNLAVCLATELGVGGLYAEELCSTSGVDKKALPKEVTVAEARDLFSALKDFLQQIEKPQGFIYEEDVTPFALPGKTELKRTKTYHEALATVEPFPKASPYEQKIKTVQLKLSKQEEAIGQLAEKITENSRKGELIYEKYQPLQKLVEIVKEMKTTKSWQEIAAELKKEKRIKCIDLKKKSIIIEL